MAIKVRFDIANNPIPPRLILATKSGNRIRELPIEQIVFHDTLMSGSEFSFVINKAKCVDKNGDIDESFWRKIVDFKIAYCPEYDMWYEITVDLNESDDTRKSCEAKSLGEAELSQIKVYGLEINTEDDIARDDYKPTVLYNPTDADTSLINRLLNKAPHYRIAHVDDSIKDIQRTFQFDGTSIYDSFQTVEEELGCLALFECRKTDSIKIDRTVSVYDLKNSCMVCNGRGDFVGVCPYCGSTAIKSGYGADTAIYIDRDNLTKDVTYSTNAGAVKNCFKLEAGDDLMTATVINCNPNGSQYIWNITDEMREDMSAELRAKLQEYDTLFAYYQNEHSWSPAGTIVSEYNAIVNKYLSTNPNLSEITSPIVGFPALMDAYYNTIDLHLFLNNGLMPSPATSGHTAIEEVAKLTTGSLSPVAVANIEACTEATATNAVLGMAKCLIYPGYQIKVATSSYDAASHVWAGSFKLINYSDDADTATSNNISVAINGDVEVYIQQKLKRTMKQRSDESMDISSLFNLSIENYTLALRGYALQGLLSIREACQVVIDILIQQGVADNTSWIDAEHDLYQTIYLPYLSKMSATESEIQVRTHELAIVAGVYDDNGGLIFSGMQSQIKQQRDEIQRAQNFEAFLGETLLIEFAAYRREDTFSNTNFISDGLNNDELFYMARQFLDLAKKELYASSTLQHSIHAEMHNLLAMRAFRPIVSQFAVGNWIRIGVDKNIYRLRLSEYTIQYEDMSLDVEFTDVRNGYSAASDIQSLLEKAQSMSTSYGAVTRQAKKGSETAGIMKNWANEGFSLTTKLVGGADRQEFVIDELGITGREYVPETGGYTDEQIRMINHGLYVTNDGWLTAKAGIGKFHFYNPRTKRIEEAFGIIADTLVGNLILSQNVGIYNENNSVEIGENGLIITTDASSTYDEQVLFTIRRRVIGESGDEEFEPILYIDENGYVVLNGSVNITSGNSSGGTTSISDLQKNIGDLQNQVTSIQADRNGLLVRIETLEQDGDKIIDSVTTSTGYTFNSDGLTIRKSNEEIENQLNNNGMYVRRYTGSTPENILVADKNGVNALNINVRKYLVIGSNSRFEDYSNGTDSMRTGCFYLGG